ncbi:zinc ribbon domain-containing protein [Deinococcus marmoris]|uniref:zinc ribbon domain-containing protein n=1 Tax=Deinococcus marmoris TaxID=249408 RepID=UPI000A9C2B69|nr:zinc ribbon domain-containing protein [Deinococcus marmoris]
MPEHTTHHVVRVDRNTYPQLRRAVASGQLQPTQENLDVMAQGQVYCPADTLLNAQTLVHDRELQMGNLTVTGELYRLPEGEYSSIITASLGVYRQYPGVQQLLTALLTPMTSTAETIWWQDVRMAVAQGRQLASGVDLTDERWTPTAWRRDLTRLIELGDHWFLILYFAQPPHHLGPRGRAVVGVDIGLRPLATAAWGQQHEVTWGLATPALPVGESAEVRALAQILNYAAARAALEAFTVLVLADAGTLVLEQLDYRGFKSNFSAVSRRRAVADWHQTWARQRAHARGIEVERVPAAYTSQTCSQCQGSTRGTRQGREFTCLHGHVMDAHINAARNLVRRYWGQQSHVQ